MTTLKTTSSAGKRETIREMHSRLGGGNIAGLQSKRIENEIAKVFPKVVTREPTHEMKLWVLEHTRMTFVMFRQGSTMMGGNIHWYFDDEESAMWFALTFSEHLICAPSPTPLQ